MKRIFKMITLIVILSIITSCYKNAHERNKIVFIDPVLDVQDSLLNMIDLLKLLPPNSDVRNRNYKVINDDIYINPTYKDGKIASQEKSFSNFSDIQRTRFNMLADYLNENFITGGYYDENLSLWRFLYKELPDTGFDDARDIVVISTAEITNELQIAYRVLDKKNNLYLMVHRDVKIK